ncbi:hypothetical protein DL95DRAFT_418389 [Leptodontidium sp. 2 PMI_412]|nr:hypothetical protein DL95DRAFT_418389 [Leptodontidium sp. 2 PMI_412]
MPPTPSLEQSSPRPCLARPHNVTPSSTTQSDDAIDQMKGLFTCKQWSEARTSIFRFRRNLSLTALERISKPVKVWCEVGYSDLCLDLDELRILMRHHRLQTSIDGFQSSRHTRHQFFSPGFPQRLGHRRTTDMTTKNNDGKPCVDEEQESGDFRISPDNVCAVYVKEIEEGWFVDCGGTRGFQRATF